MSRIINWTLIYFEGNSAELLFLTEGGTGRDYVPGCLTSAVKKPGTFAPSLLLSSAASTTRITKCSEDCQHLFFTPVFRTRYSWLKDLFAVEGLYSIRISMQELFFGPGGPVDGKGG